jgi:O-antigen ligase
MSAHSLRQKRRLFAFAALLLTLAGGVVLWRSSALPAGELPVAESVDRLESGLIASMNSPVFTYSPGWQVTSAGADPPEPADPFAEPSGSVTFVYHGDELALKIAVGDYWGYFYVTVDGEPANLLPVTSGNASGTGAPAGYKSLYAPEAETADGPGERWLRVHAATEPSQDHDVRIEMWRSWDAMPLRAVAVDVLTAPPPRWPGAALLIAAMWCALCALFGFAHSELRFLHQPRPRRRRLAIRLLYFWSERTGLWVAIGAVGVLVLAVIFHVWLPVALAVALLAFASVQRPALWFAAFFFALPFYYRFPLPLLPARAMSLVDVGVICGSAVVLAHLLLRRWSGDELRPRLGGPLAILFGLLTSWALLSALAAEHLSVALREWRVLFLYGALLYCSLWLLLSLSRNWRSDIWLLVIGWLGGAAFVSLFALAFYQTEVVAFDVEGVRRLAGFYGSPNNLALYLDRTVAVTLALALFASQMRHRLLWATLALPQLLALLLTFSKGAMLIALPAMLLTLWLGGFLLLKHRGRSTTTLWWLAVAGLVAALVATPAGGAERFQKLLDFSQGTSFLRINLWRSSLQMGLDHSLWGVGPDNFLSAYRSGYLLPEAWQEPNLNHPHNWVLDWWTRLGLIGLALGVVWWGITAAYLVRKVGCGEGDHGALRLGLLAAVIAALAHGLIDASYALPDLMAAWVLITFLAIALWQETSSGQTEFP